MMKIKIEVSKSATAMYTAQLLRHLVITAGGEIVTEPANADWIFISLCDPDDIPILLAAQKYKNKIIIGGFEAYFPAAYIGLARYIVVGEGFRFIPAFIANRDAALTMACVLDCENYEGREVFPDYFIDWRNVPVAKLPGKNRYHLLAGRGCKFKCSFCATSWCMPHQTISPGVLAQMRSKLNGGSVKYITNDYDGVLGGGKRNSSISVRAIDYLDNPGAYRASMIHVGVEGWTEQCRKSFNKPVSDRDIRSLFAELRMHRQRAQLFFLVGYPGFDVSMIDHFASAVLPLDPVGLPAIYFKLTYFDPLPHTPLGKAPVAGVQVDIGKITKLFNGHNKRVRIYPSRSVGRSAWRTVLHRIRPDEVFKLGPDPKDTNCIESFESFRDKLAVAGLDNYLVGQKSLLNEKIVKVSINERKT
jgi:hypothetical protein